MTLNDLEQAIANLHFGSERLLQAAREISRLDLFTPNDRDNNWRKAMAHLRLEILGCQDTSYPKYTYNQLINMLHDATIDAKGEPNATHSDD